MGSQHWQHIACELHTSAQDVRRSRKGLLEEYSCFQLQRQLPRDLDSARLHSSPRSVIHDALLLVSQCSPRVNQRRLFLKVCASAPMSAEDCRKLVGPSSGLKILSELSLRKQRECETDLSCFPVPRFRGWMCPSGGVKIDQGP